MRLEPRIGDYMMKAPAFVSPQTSLTQAMSTLRSSGSGYLPVLSGRKVVGILKAQPLLLAASYFGPEIPVKRIMSRKAAVATPTASLYEILDKTPDNVYGCTIVQDTKGKVVGIFSPKEAMMALHKLATGKGEKA